MLYVCHSWARLHANAASLEREIHRPVAKGNAARAFDKRKVEKNAVPFIHHAGNHRYLVYLPLWHSPLMLRLLRSAALVHMVITARLGYNLNNVAVFTNEVDSVLNVWVFPKN